MSIKLPLILLLLIALFGVFLGSFLVWLTPQDSSSQIASSQGLIENAALFESLASVNSISLVNTTSNQPQADLPPLVASSNSLKDNNLSLKSQSSTSAAPAANIQKTTGIAAVFLPPDEIRKGSKILPLSTAINNLTKYDAFWFAQNIANTHPDAWKLLRSRFPQLLAMHYVTPCSARPDGGDSYLDFDYIEKNHPEWFLLTDQKNAAAKDYRNHDKRMRWNPNDPKDWRYNRFFLDVGNEAFQQWATEEFLKKLNPASGINSGIRYSGIAADNVLLTVWHKSKTQLYPNWKYASSAASWNQAYFSYLKRLRDALNKQGYKLIVNHTTDYSSNRDGKEWQDLMAVVDGMTDEEALGAPRILLSGEQWEWSLKHHEETLQKGLYDWWIFTPDTSDSIKEYQQFLYVYCSFLLVKQKSLSLFGSVRRRGSVELDPWYEEYNLPLGEPVGARYKRQDCWFRDYQYGQIIVNPGNNRRTIPLENSIYNLDWRAKKKIAELTLEPRTATFLLPTEYKANQ